jgi:uncharacterized protein YhaN
VRILRVSIDGYGRLAGFTREFAPGLQVIVGPNEMGKSTLRAFITDMLYGQKVNTLQRVYDENQALRLPWENPDCYGGALVFELDGGQRIEVVRNFGRERESLQLFDRGDNLEITADFERLRNGEVNFTASWLGLGKEVFGNVAVITHLGLEGLGDRDALNAIREKLLSLADSGWGGGSAGSALEVLEKRLGRIGRPGEKANPLSSLRARVIALEAERETIRRLRGEIASESEKRRELIEAIAELRERRECLESDLDILRAHDRARRLRDAEHLAARIDTATKHCFALSKARNFPLEDHGSVHQAAERAREAAQQLRRSREEYASLRAQLQREENSTEENGNAAFEELPEELETRFAESYARLRQLEDRAEEQGNAVSEAAAEVETAQSDLAGYPDFARISSDPVEWLTQLVSSFTTALRTREEERKVRERLRAEIAQRRDSLAAAQQTFQNRLDFPELARDHEVKTRMHREQIEQHEQVLHMLEGAREEIADRIPGLKWSAAFCVLFLGVLGGTFCLVRNPAIFLPGAAISLAIFYFLLSLFYFRRKRNRLSCRILKTQRELAELMSRRKDISGPIEDMMREAGCETLRELEAMYEQYRSESAELAARLEVLEEQESRTLETEERIPLLLDQIRRTFEQIGEAVTSEEEVESAAQNAISKYQLFRDLKRKLTDRRAVLDRQQRALRDLETATEAARGELAGNEADLRGAMHANGFAEESLFADPAEALRQYHARIVHGREQRGRLGVMREKEKSLEMQIAGEEKEREEAETQLAALIGKTGAATVEEWDALAEQAREYNEVWEKRCGLEEQLNALLQDGRIEDLREMAAKDGELPPPPAASRDQLHAEINALNEAINARMEEEHALHLELAGRGAGSRPLNEAEEEYAVVRRRLELLENEHEATAYAMTLLEEIARDRHLRIAPQLAAKAGAMLAEITGGNYSDLEIGRDLSIRLAIPGTGAENPEKALSKGATDQVYLALRMALIQTLSETGESIPMLLDDPFANYDDDRLERSIGLLRELAAKNQILIFTCRDDVVRTAGNAGAAILRMEALPE